MLCGGFEPEITRLQNNFLTTQPYLRVHKPITYFSLRKGRQLEGKVLIDLTINIVCK